MADELTNDEEKTDWYGVLGIGVGVDENAISKAFKKMSLRWHPDKNGGSQEAHDMFMRVKEAKLFLMDSKKRKLYDEKRAARHKMESLLVSFLFYWCYRLLKHCYTGGYDRIYTSYVIIQLLLYLRL